MPLVPRDAVAAGDAGEATPIALRGVDLPRGWAQLANRCPLPLPLNWLLLRGATEAVRWNPSWGRWGNALNRVMERNT